MYQRVKRLSQTLFVLTLITIVSVLSIAAINTYSDYAVAQEPLDSPSLPVSEETLAAFGLSADSIGAADVSFDLEVNKIASVATITSGGYVTYIITIINNGNDSAGVVMFKDNYPTNQMSDVSFDFSQPATSDGHTPPTWLFDDPIANSQTAVVTVTGKLEAGIGTTIQNTAEVIAFGETDPSNNTNSASVTISGGGSGSTILYLPIIHKAPPRRLIVSDNFSDSDSGWTSADDSDCERGYADNQYRMKADNKETCFTPAPSKINGTSIEYTYVEYQVSAKVSSGDGNFDYGIYMNGAGGDNYYLFRIKPDENCGWRLIRRKNGSNTTLGSGNDCNSAGINIGTGWNTFAIRHDHDGLISVFINDQNNNNTTPLFTINDGNSLTGKGAGLFVEADDSKDITARFDNFQVYTVAP